MKRRISAGLLAVVVAAVCLTACGRTKRSFEACVTAGDYDDAISMYESQIDGNSKKELEAETFLRQYMEGVLTQYATGEIDDQQAQSALSCLEKIDDELYLLGEDLSLAQEQVEALQQSKEWFRTGTEKMEGDDYVSALEAMGCFRWVIEEDTQNYDRAQEQMALAYKIALEDLADETKELMGQGKFEEATQLLEDNDIMAMFEGDADYEALRETLHTGWEDSVLQSAAEAFANGKDYAAALQIIQSSELQGERIDAEIERYREYEPVSLSLLDTKEITEYIEEGGPAPVNCRTDLKGNEYEDTAIYPKIGMMMMRAETEDQGHVTYVLNGKYSRLTGVLYIPENTLSCSDKQWNEPTIVKLYGDDKLLYEAPSLSRENVDPINLDLDVTGVQDLKVVMIGVWFKDMGDYVNSYPKVCAANLQVWK